MEKKEQKVNKILYYVNISCVESKSKKDLLTPNHTKFDCIISYKDKEYNFNYQCNLNYSKPTKENLIACLFSDAGCYESCKINDDDIENMQEFSNMFGYENNLKELFKVYNGCKETYNALRKMFTEEEKELLLEYFEEEGLL